MSTYLINHLRIPGDIPNEEAVSYLEQVEDTAKNHGGKWLAQGEARAVEGTWPGAVVLMEFPDMAHAETWYNPPEYQKILPLRVNNAISDLVLVDGVTPDFTAAGYAGQIRNAIAAASASDGRGRS
ncbi:DUF1330 domain-containing protein [Streptomyces sp. NPDC088725]|uniref:DUF1330 domain-containing protein n=1 Tax=Streptomyces sp. NPDC088725 TaxID=3365873 RepID=UPI003805E781